MFYVIYIDSHKCVFREFSPKEISWIRARFQAVLLKYFVWKKSLLLELNLAKFVILLYFLA